MALAFTEGGDAKLAWQQNPASHAASWSCAGQATPYDYRCDQWVFLIYQRRCELPALKFAPNHIGAMNEGPKLTCALAFSIFFAN